MSSAAELMVVAGQWWSAAGDWCSGAFAAAQGRLFESAMEPAMLALGLGAYVEDGFDAAGLLLWGCLQIVAMVALLRPLERLFPAEASQDRREARVDVVYSLIAKLGLFQAAMFLLARPAVDGVLARLRVWGLGGVQLDQMWPGVTDRAWASFLIYLVALDFLDYWIHRGQHAWRWWWSLHALHHSQRSMTMWSDSRNHLLDDAIRWLALAAFSALLGASPGQFLALGALSQLAQSAQHANVRFGWGRLIDRLLVSPRFHRIHHGVGLGHESRGRGTLGGRNFGALFPWWDMAFGTADFHAPIGPTGVRDQFERGRSYGSGYLQQQWLGIKRLARRA